MSVHLLGIRHHGPGSARAVQTFLEETAPDIVLIEGPPEADSLLVSVIAEEMQPPVALLLYQPEDPQRALFYPFAEFSPEWSAAKWAAGRGVPVRFMDLPVEHSFAFENEEREKLAEQAVADEQTDGEPTTEPASHAGEPAVDLEENASLETAPGLDSSDKAGLPSPEHPHPLAADASAPEPYRDPITHLAIAAGWEDGEAWWEHTFEHRRDSTEIFTTVAEAMTALRETLPPRDDAHSAKQEALREAWMRKTIKAAQKEGFASIAVVCGA